MSSMPKIVSSVTFTRQQMMTFTLTKMYSAPKIIPYDWYVM